MKPIKASPDNNQSAFATVITVSSVYTKDSLNKRKSTFFVDLNSYTEPIKSLAIAPNISFFSLFLFCFIHISCKIHYHT